MAKDVYERLEWRVKRIVKGQHVEFCPQWCFKFLFIRIWVNATLRNELNCQYTDDKDTKRNALWYRHEKHPLWRLTYEKQKYAIGFIEKYEAWRKYMAELKHEVNTHPFIKA